MQFVLQGVALSLEFPNPQWYFQRTMTLSVLHYFTRLVHRVSTQSTSVIRLPWAVRLFRSSPSNNNMCFFFSTYLFLFYRDLLSLLRHILVVQQQQCLFSLMVFFLSFFLFFFQHKISQDITNRLPC